MKKLFIILSIIIVFSSCDFERTINIGEIPITPHMVINGLIYANADTSYLYITESRPIYRDSVDIWNNTKSGYKIIKNVDIDFRINDTHRSIKYIAEDTAYVSIGKIVAGDKVSLESVYNNQKIKSIALLPHAPEVISVDTIHISRIENNNLKEFIVFKVKIKDKPGSKDYYRLLVNNKLLYYSNGHLQDYSGSYYSNDPVLIGNFTDTNMGLSNRNDYSIFRDVSFEGKEYTLTFDVDKYSPQESLIDDRKDMWHLTVKLQSISEDLYKYYSSRQRGSQNWWDKVTEPVLIHSNIEGGLGILGACNEIQVFEYKNF